MPKIRTFYNHVPVFEDTREWESICEPGAAWGLQELLDRHTKGLLTDVTTKQPIYRDADHSSPDLRKVMTSDLYEREEHARATAETVEKLKRRKGKTAPEPTTPKSEEVKKEIEGPKEEPKKEES